MPQNVLNWRSPECNPEDVLLRREYRITLIGVGALGSQIARELTLFSTPPLAKVILIDPDMVQFHNIPASDAWSELVQNLGQHVIGNSKSECIATYCTNRAPRTQWISKPCEIADIGWGELAESDVFITATDSVLSRMEVAYAARMLGKPMLDAGVLGSGLIGGRVTYFDPGEESACYSCGLSTAARAAVLEHLASPSLSCATLPPTESMGSSLEGVESVRSVARRVAQQLSQESSGTGSRAWKMRGEATETVSLTVSSECPWHTSRELVALADDRPIRDVLSPDQVLLLPWPMAFGVVCERCGTQSDTLLRLAKLRQGARCTRCGETTLQPLQVLERIYREDAVAGRSPRQLGLPGRNVLPVRKRIQMQRTF